MDVLHLRRHEQQGQRAARRVLELLGLHELDLGHLQDHAVMLQPLGLARGRDGAHLRHRALAARRGQHGLVDAEKGARELRDEDVAWGVGRGRGVGVSAGVDPRRGDRARPADARMSVMNVNSSKPESSALMSRNARPCSVSATSESTTYLRSRGG